MSERQEMEEFIGLKVPKSFKEKLEAYAKANGYSISYIVRKCVEAEILGPNLPLQHELWRGLLQWQSNITDILIKMENANHERYKELSERLNFLKAYVLILSTLFEKSQGLEQGCIEKAVKEALEKAEKSYEKALKEG